MFQIKDGTRIVGPGRRTRPRLLVAADIRAKPANSADWTFATLRDVSMGGAQLVVADCTCQPGDTIDLRLPCKDHENLVVDAEILRIEPCDGGSLIGVKFETGDVERRSKVDDTLAVLLSQTGGGRRAHARVSSRMEIQYGDNAELKGILEDLSEGGFLMLTVDVAPNLGQLVQVRIPNPHGADLDLFGRVVRRSNTSPDARPDTLVGLQFEKMSEDDEEEIGLLIDWLLFLRDEPELAA
ncbi:MAG: PilZ domain-containing protein [Gammaproteobacteria bacterium]|nr:PilZ domain-containing protein [Gammaproteobacteria bacterium]MDH3465917.1 PilZ domain-containing protein [Gammaproteobacteria bacterium]